MGVGVRRGVLVARLVDVGLGAAVRVAVPAGRVGDGVEVAVCVGVAEALGVAVPVGVAEAVSVGLAVGV